MDVNTKSSELSLDPSTFSNTPVFPVGGSVMEGSGLLQSCVKQEPQEQSDNDLYNYDSMLQNNRTDHNEDQSAQVAQVCSRNQSLHICHVNM